MDTHSTIGVAVIGTGRAGMIHAANFVHGVRRCRLVALADSVEQAVLAAGNELGVEDTYTDFRAALRHPHVDAVVIATPTSLHAEIAVAAAEHGKHILCEKPMAITVAECDAMLAATERAGVVLQIGFMRRYSEDFLAAKARIDAGDIGSVVQVKTLTHGPSQPKPWMFNLQHSNGPLAEVNSHDIDTVRWMSGSEFADVYAIAGNYRTPEAQSTHPDFYDQVLLVSRMANGGQGSISGAQGVKVSSGADLDVEIEIAHDLLHDRELLGVLPSEVRSVRANELELVQDARRHQADDIRQRRHLVVRAPRRLGHRRAADLVAPLEHGDAPAAPGEQASGDQAVVATADHQDVGALGHASYGSAPSARAA